MKIAKIAVNVLKVEPDDDKAVPNVLTETLLGLFGLQHAPQLQGRYVSIEPNALGDGFVLTPYRASGGLGP